jgi:hypothetical protein
MEGLNMPTIKIDNQDYNTDKLSNEAKGQLIKMQFCDQERLGLFLKSYSWGRQGGIQ